LPRSHGFGYGEVNFGAVRSKLDLGVNRILVLNLAMTAA
jgi:hypothetical protein